MNKLTKMEAVRAYLRVARELQRLHGSASEHISRRDNNWQFELYYSLKDVARRMLREYNNEGEYEGGGPSERDEKIKRLTAERDEALLTLAQRDVKDLRTQVQERDNLLKELITQWDLNEIGQVDGDLIDRARAMVNLPVPP